LTVNEEFMACDYVFRAVDDLKRSPISIDCTPNYFSRSLDVVQKCAGQLLMQQTLARKAAACSFASRVSVRLARNTGGRDLFIYHLC
jgi:hypothetical protein